MSTFFSYLFRIYVASNTVQVISQRVVLWAEETSPHSWSRFCIVNCRPSVSNYQLSHIRFGVDASTYSTDLISLSEPFIG